MNRRTLIKNMALVSGGMFLGTEMLLKSCKNATAGAAVMDANQLIFLDEITETLLPKTETVGAKDCQVGNFIKKVYDDIFSEEEQKLFNDTLKLIDEKSNNEFKNDFIKLTPEQKTKVLNTLNTAKDKGFMLIKDLAVYGYISSEKGLQASTRYTPVPGKYVGEVPYKVGEKMYSGLNLHN